MQYLSAGAESVGGLLLESVGDWVAEDRLSESTGFPGYGVRWYIFQLRSAGWKIEAVKDTDRAAFREGARGWRLVDIGEATHADPSAPVATPAKQRKLRVGDRVGHPEYGVGVVAFTRKGFDSVRVTLDSGEDVKAERSVLVLLD